MHKHHGVTVWDKNRCVRMHIGKTQNKDLCCSGEVDTWKQELITDHDGNKHLTDVYGGKEEIKHVENTKYLGEIISMNMKNEMNIKDKTNKAHGNIKKIEDTINERPYGIHTYKAALLL